MIELKSAREIGLMRTAGHILADVVGCACGPGEAGHVHPRDRRGRRGVHPAPEGASRPSRAIGASRRRSASRSTRRSCTGFPPPSGDIRRATSSAWTSGVSWRGTTRTARSRCRGRGQPTRSQELLDVTRRASSTAIEECRPGQPRRRRLARRPEARRGARVRGRARLRRPRDRPGAARGAAGAELRRAGRGPLLRPGMVLAIEPMVTMGSWEVRDPGRTAGRR